MTVRVIFLSINSNNELQRGRGKKEAQRDSSLLFYAQRFKKVIKNSFKRHRGHVFTLYGISKLRLTGRGNDLPP